MEPLPAKIIQIGNGEAIIIPSMVAAFLGFKPGMMLRVRLVPGGTPFDALARQLAHSVGILIPKAVLRAHGLERGQEILVPFGEWHAVGASKRDEKKPRRKTKKV